MTVQELIDKLDKFNPDGRAKVCTHYFVSDYNDAIDHLSMEEDADGNLVVIIHTSWADLDGNE